MIIIIIIRYHDTQRTCRWSLSLFCCLHLLPFQPWACHAAEMLQPEGDPQGTWIVSVVFVLCSISAPLRFHDAELELSSSCFRVCLSAVMVRAEVRAAVSAHFSV